MTQRPLTGVRASLGDPAEALRHSAITRFNRDPLACLRGEGQADRNGLGFYQMQAGQRSERLSSEILVNRAAVFKWTRRLLWQLEEVTCAR